MERRGRVLSVDAQGGERLGSPRGTGGRRGQRREGTRALMPSMEARTGAWGGHRGYEREGRAEGPGGGAGRVQQTGRAGMGTALEMRVLGWGPGGRRVPFRRGHRG